MIVLASHQERVVREKSELDEKLTKLIMFSGSPTFNGLAAAERDRLQRQSRIMSEYSEVLQERIAAF